MVLLRHMAVSRSVFEWRQRWAGPSILALVLAGLTGCGDKPEGGLTRLNPRGVPFLSGIAVPEGFSLVDRNTEDYESGGSRWARHCYRGHADPIAIRNFYREQMPLLGWNLVSDQSVKGIISIRLENPDESCTVQIERDGLFNRCTIQVILMPLSRTPKEPPPRRPMP